MTRIVKLVLKYLPFWVGIGSLTVTFGAWHLLTVQNNEYIQQILETEAEKKRLLIAAKLTQASNALVRMANRSIYPGMYRTRESWDADAALHMEHYRGFKGLAWISPELKVRWVHPHKGNENLQGYDVSKDPARFEALRSAESSRQPTFTRGLKLIHGDRGFIIYIPIVLQNRVRGFLSGGFQYDHFFRTATDGELADGYRMEISDVDGLVYDDGEVAADAGTASVVKVSSLNKSWQLRLVPTQEKLNELKSQGPFWALVMGALVSAILTLLVIVSQRNRRFAESLETSEERFRLLINAAKDYAIVMLDPNGYVSSWNEGATRIKGYAASEILGQHFSILYVPEDRARNHPQFELLEALRVGKYEEEGIRVRKDGRHFYARVLITPIYDRLGTHIGFSKITRDITDTKKAGDRLSLALETTQIGIWDWDIAGNSLEWDAQMHRIYGVAPGVYANLLDGFQNGLHPDDRVRVNQEVQAAIANTKRFDTEFRVVTPSGEVRMVKAKGHVVWDANQKPMRMLGANIDITASHKLEKLASERLREVETANRRFELIAQGASVGIWDWIDVTKSEEFWSPKFYALLGYEEGEIESNMETFKSLVHPDDLNPTLVAVAEHFETHLPFDVEYRLRMKTGEYRWFQGTGQAAFNAHGQPMRMVGTIQDIHPKKLLEEELRSAVRARSMFLANMSHEIRTPMNGVVGMTTLLGQCSLPQEAREYVETIRKSSDVLLNLLNDILDISKVEAGKVVLEKESFDIRNTIETVIDLFAEAASTKNLCLSGIVHPSVPKMIIGDSTRFQQVLSNLVSNAVKFTQAGEIAIRLSAEGIFDENTLLTLDVRDTVIGMAPDVLEKIFSPFTQGDTSTTRRFGGTGLGLSISKKLVQLMGGDIEVSSAVGRGSRFRICLPFQRRIDESPTPASFASANVFIYTQNPYVESTLGEMFELKGNRPLVLSSLSEIENLSPPLSGGILLFDVEGDDLDLTDWERKLNAAWDREGCKVVFLLPRAPQGYRLSDRANILRKPLKQSQVFQLVAQAIGVDQGLSFQTPPADVNQDEFFFNADGNPLICLIAEDNSTNQKVMVRMMEKMGITCDLVGSGLEALAAIQKVPYDLVLMDCFMPVMDGYEATRHIRSLPFQVGKMPIIAVTANVSKTEKSKCQEAGMDAYIAKPIDFLELRRTLRLWFQSSTRPVKKAAA